MIAVLVGGVLLALTLAYAELLRRYGSPGVVDGLLDGVHWSRDHLGAFPRPIEAVLGVPALAWGCHMRARRRQGWWVCAFGVAATAPVAQALLDPRIGLLESGAVGGVRRRRRPGDRLPADPGRPARHRAAGPPRPAGRRRPRPAGPEPARTRALL